jgi:PAS domain S-box-containing protein
MNNQDKTKDELIKELQKLQLDYDSLKTSYAKEINKRKLAEEALKFTRLILDNAADTMAIIDYDGRFIDVNNAFCRSVGYSREQLLSMTVHDIDPLFPAATWSEFWEKLKQAGSLTFESRHRTKDGNLIPVEINVNFFEYKGKEYHSGFARDITERKQAEETLRESEERWRKLVTTVPNFIALHDLKGMYIFLNHYAEGFSEKEVIGRSLYDFIAGDSREEYRRNFNACIKSKQTQRFIYSAFGDNRALKIYETYLVPIIEKDQIINVMAIATDITERIRAEESLKQALDWEQAIFEGSRDSIFISDQDARFVAVNDAACNLTGYSREQLLKMRISDIHDSPDLDAYKMYHQRIFDGEEILSEAKILRSNGVKIDTEFNNRCVSIAGKLYMHTTARNITERKRAEEQLQESKKKFQSLVETTGDFIWEMDLNGAYTYCSPQIDKLWGFKPEEMLGKTPFDLLPPEDREQTIKAFSAISQSQSSFMNMEISSFDSSSQVKFLEISGVPFFDHEGNIGGYRGITRDITERKQAEEVLHESEERFRRLYQQAPLGYQSLDAEGCFIDVNQAWLDLLQYPRNEVIGRWFGDFLAPQEVDAFRQRFQCFKATGEVHVDLEMVQRTGSRIIVHIDGKTGHDENGQFKQTHCILHNITERKHVEKALNLEKENFRHSLDDSPLGVRIVTTEGDTIYANQTILNFYGYDSLGELQRTPLKDRYTPASYVQAQKRKHQRESGDLSASDYEISIVRKNGEIRHLQVFRKGVLWDGARQFQILYNDITERKKDEEEIRKSKKLLEDLHKHLDEIRENERAQISREIHDQIGQSLTALKLDLNWMEKYIKETNPETVAKFQDMIELVTGTIKDVQRISSDLRPGILDDLGLAAAIEWYSDEFEKRSGIRCSLKLDDSIFGDPQKNLVFFRVLQEALTNVIRHANASSVTIKLHQTQKGTTLTIQDNGIGITAEMIESTKALGLMGMRERVRQFDGKVDVSSKKGQGTKLTVFIPEKKKIMS